jgi:hypothetical protein
MNKEVSKAIGRLDLYLFRTKRAIRTRDYTQALADVAELSEIARRLWVRISKELILSALPSGAKSRDSH